MMEFIGNLSLLDALLMLACALAGYSMSMHSYELRRQRKIRKELKLSAEEAEQLMKVCSGKILPTKAPPGPPPIPERKQYIVVETRKAETPTEGKDQ